MRKQLSRLRIRKIQLRKEYGGVNVLKENWDYLKNEPISHDNSDYFEEIGKLKEILITH